MRNWKLTLEYDGTKYSGWQEQKNARTVAGEIRKAAEEIFETEVDLHGSGPHAIAASMRRRRLPT